MPRERKDFFRKSGTAEKERIIVLAFEGNNTERLYFEELKLSEKFNGERICLHLLIRAKADTSSAPNQVFNKLKREAKDEYNFNKSDELWMIIDRDRWENIPNVINLCKEQGNMFVAVSNPCFEFWLLLHIKNFATLSGEEKDKLLSNSKITRNKRYIDDYLTKILEGGYNKSKPKPERFIPSVAFAISQAKGLNRDNEDFPSGLGSHVYKVAEKLIKDNNV